MSVTSTTGKGLVTPNETQIILEPSAMGEKKYPIIYTHGAGSGADIATNYGNQTVTANNLARAGVVGVSGDYGGTQTWGNNDAMRTMTDAYNYLQNRPDVKKGKVSIHGGSMGGLNALVWAAANLDKVACLSLEIPVIDLVGIWRYNISGFQTLINAAYGGLFNVGDAVTRDPLTMARNGVFNGVPMFINYGDSDAICLAEKTDEFLSHVPSAIGVKHSGGHSESTQLKVNRQQQYEFIMEHS